MRHLFAAVSAFGMLGVLVGCHHVCGIYDCDIPGHRCGCCNYDTNHGPIAPMPIVTGAEPIKGPKDEGKAPEPKADAPKTEAPKTEAPKEEAK